MNKVNGPRAFICHVKDDSERALELYHQLADAGIRPWLDKIHLRLGDNYEREIKMAVMESNVFIVCLRPGFNEIGFRQKEVRWAMDAIERRPIGQGFIIPYVLIPCDIPEWCSDLHAGPSLDSPTSFNELVLAIYKHGGPPFVPTMEPLFIENRRSNNELDLAPVIQRIRYALSSLDRENDPDSIAVETAAKVLVMEGMGRYIPDSELVRLYHTAYTASRLAKRREISRDNCGND